MGFFDRFIDFLRGEATADEVLEEEEEYNPDPNDWISGAGPGGGGGPGGGAVAGVDPAVQGLTAELSTDPDALDQPLSVTEGDADGGAPDEDHPQDEQPEADGSDPLVGEEGWQRVDLPNEAEWRPSAAGEEGELVEPYVDPGHYAQADPVGDYEEDQLGEEYGPGPEAEEPDPSAVDMDTDLG